MQLRELFDDTPIHNQAVTPLAIQQLMRESLDVTGDWGQAESLLLTACRELPDQLEIQVALYKLYAYSNRFDESMNFIDRVLEGAATKAGFDSNWRQLTTASAPWHNATGAVRIYLYSLKARGFVNLRQGYLNAAYEVLKKLRELDVDDQVGGSVVYQMAEHLLDGDE